MKTILDEVDKDNSGSIEFKEFAELMDKVNKGQIQVGASLLAQRRPRTIVRPQRT